MQNMPGLANWLQKVFWVMGGYIISTGLLTVFLLDSHFLRKRTREAFNVGAIAGITSIGSVMVGNLMIGSDFKWLLLSFLLPWAIALIRYRLCK